MEQANQEMQRTAFQKKAVSKLAPDVVLDLAVELLKAEGYRAGRTGRPNQVFVLGGREGSLPRVTGEISARGNVGKPGTTLVTIDGFGERLGPALRAFYTELRVRSRSARSTIGPPEAGSR